MGSQKKLNIPVPVVKNLSNCKLDFKANDFKMTFKFYRVKSFYVSRKKIENEKSDLVEETLQDPDSEKVEKFEKDDPAKTLENPNFVEKQVENLYSPCPGA